MCRQRESSHRKCQRHCSSSSIHACLHQCQLAASVVCMRRGQLLRLAATTAHIAHNRRRGRDHVPLAMHSFTCPLHGSDVLARALSLVDIDIDIDGGRHWYGYYYSAAGSLRPVAHLLCDRPIPIRVRRQPGSNNSY